MTNATHDLAEGEAALSRLLDDMAAEGLDLNEADTRHRFIDRLIHECLAWDRSKSTRLERHFNGDYSDYELGVPPQVVIEAKRAGQTFLVPSEGTHSIVRSIRSLTSSSHEFKAAFNQALKYCHDRGIQLGAVANSTQIVVFLGVRNDGVPPAEGKCLVFNGPQQLKNNFHRLWQAISPDATSRKLLLADLISSAPTGVPPKLSSYIPGYPSFRYPSESQQSLKTLSDLLIEDAPNTPAVRKRFLEECYCESGALAKEALLGKNILSARYAAMFNPAAEGPRLQNLKSSTSDQYGLSPEVIADALGRRPIVIIGDVGVGKTSFIRHLIYVRAADEMANAIFLYLDLGSQASLGQEIHQFFLGEIERQLLEDHGVDLYEDKFVRGVYHSELQRFERGIHGRLKETAPDKFLERQIEHLEMLTKEKALHLQKCISHLAKGRRKQLLICIDNADQRDLRIQQEAFLAAQEFAANWQALVLISIRPRTYFTSKSSGSISAYPQRILTISPPRIDLVLQKRLTFSLDLAEGRLPLDRLEGITVRLDSIAIFLKALIHSLRNNKDLAELLENITGGNIREALELIKGFIGSANVDSEKIISIIRSGDGRYVIPLHEFSKQALLGEYSHYDAKSSIAFNLFDIRYPDRREHFLCSIIVAFLLSDSSAKTAEGFLPTSAVLREMQSFGFVSDQVEHALRRLTNKKLIETTERITFDEGLQGLVGDMPLAFRATTIGSYHVQRWAPSFAYLDAMLFDTPILDESVRNEAILKLSSSDIRMRYKRTVAFDDYLKASWEQFEARPVYFDWPTIRLAGSSSFSSVKRATESRP
jgi:GTPase SAR1 family protein